MSFGQSSERMRREIEQLELRLEELETAEAVELAPTEALTGPEEALETPAPQKKKRSDFPAHLPRSEVVHEPVQTCPACGGAMRKVGEAVTEILEYIPGRFEVIRHVRPACFCQKCEAMAQAPMPSLPIPRGQAGPGLLSHVLISKYCDHLPLYLQSQIYARDGIELDRALLADWMGRIAERTFTVRDKRSRGLTAPLVEAIAQHVKAGDAIHADDTPVPVLAPGSAKTRQSRQWVYLRDERPHGSGAPPACVVPLHAEPQGRASESGTGGVCGLPACRWVCRVRRFVICMRADPISSRSSRLRAGRMRGASCLTCTRPRSRVFDARLEEISGKSELASAIRYARSRWEAFTRYAGDGRLEISNNAVKPRLDVLATGRIYSRQCAGGRNVEQC